MQKKQFFTVEEIKRKLEQYCVYQDRCHKEVEQKLGDFNLIAEAREQILLSLIQDNFLNEERFAKSYARGKFRIKNWGKQRIVRELKFREISSYNIKTALQEIDEKEYLKSIHDIATKRNQQIIEVNPYQRKQKLIGFLQRKGYEMDLVYKVVNSIVEAKQT